MIDRNQIGAVPHKPVRVLHVLEATLGGTLRYLENIAEATAGSGIQFALAYGHARADSRLQPFLARIAGLGWKSYPIDMQREIRPRSDLRALLELRRVVREFAPDLMHCHSSKAGALGRAAVLLIRHAPARLYSPHALAAPLGSRYLQIERLLSRLTDGFVAVSTSERDQIVGFSLAPQHAVSIVYPSVDSDYFSPAQRQQARDRLQIGDTPLLLSIGRLTLQKNPAAFIEIVRRVHASRPDVSAIWVGSGAGEVDFDAMVAASGMEGVIQIATWQHDVRDYIAAADVFLSTSKFESFGYVTAEALSMGRPVVASDVTGTRDIMEGPLRPWLYPPGDPDRAAALILRLLDSPAEASAVAGLGRSEVKRRFSKERMRDSLIETYAKTLERLGRSDGDLHHARSAAATR